jgi:hypothetical protein
VAAPAPAPDPVPSWASPTPAASDAAPSWGHAGGSPSHSSEEDGDDEH